MRHRDHVPADGDVGGEHRIREQDRARRRPCRSRDPDAGVDDPGVAGVVDTPLRQARDDRRPRLPEPAQTTRPASGARVDRLEATEHRNTVDGGAVQRDVVVEEPDDPTIDRVRSTEQHLARQSAGGDRRIG